MNCKCMNPNHIIREVGSGFYLCNNCKGWILCQECKPHERQADWFEDGNYVCWEHAKQEHERYSIHVGWRENAERRKQLGI